MSNKTKLSKNILEMKFMRKSALKVEEELNKEENQVHIDEEHWVLDVPDLAKDNHIKVESSYQACAGLKQFGRFSYQGMNSNVEKLMVKFESDKYEEPKIKVDGEISDEEFAERYETLVGTIAKKFKNRKRKHSSEEEVKEEVKPVMKKKKQKKHKK